jgi:hypothetical protein
MAPGRITLGVTAIVFAFVLGGGSAAAQDKAVPLPVQQDPGDYQAVQQVCTVCHNTSRIMHSHTWAEWQDLLNRMSSFGAKGSDQQWDSISRFLLRTLTLIDINEAGLDEIRTVLNVDEDTAAAIVSRRGAKPFTSADDLASIPGVDQKRLEEIKPRLRF